MKQAKDTSYVQLTLGLTEKLLLMIFEFAFKGLLPNGVRKLELLFQR